MKSSRLINGAIGLITAGALALGMLLVETPYAMADSHGVGAQAGHGGHHGQGNLRGHGKQRGCHRYGKHAGGAGHHGRDQDRLFGPDWRTTLTEKQQAELDGLRLAYLKEKMPMRARAQSIKTELAVLSLKEQPDTGAISAKVDELLLLKRAMMTHKYRYIISQRGVLTPEQRVSFDMDVMKRAKHRDQGKRRH